MVPLSLNVVYNVR